jgi:H+-transporting ATPase
MASQLEIDLNGLSSEEARKRLGASGYNEVPEEKDHPVVRFLKEFWGITPWMLEVTMALEWFLGKHFETYVVMGLLAFNAVLGFVQEERANSALELLKERLKIKARVRRDGNWALVPARELVPGDVVRLRAGDFIPADVRGLEGSVEVDQSSLTGESQFLEKQADEILYSGSVVRRGEITAVVTATGARTYFGKTMQLVQIAKPKLHMEEVTSRVARWLIVIVLSFLAVALVFAVSKGLHPIHVIPLAVVLLVSAVPVALPTMFAISMALGSLELMKQGILITRLSAIEDAATMDIVCADKTGTMTMNRLSLEEEMASASSDEGEVVLYGALASHEADQDPIDLAFITAAGNLRLPLEEYVQKKFIPFDPSTRRTEAILEKDGKTIHAVKGAINTIVPLCKNGTDELSRVQQRVESLSAKGYRAIAVAKGNESEDMELVGIAFLYDEPRQDSAQLIRELKNLGLGVKMLTGDALPIAQEVSRQLNLEGSITRISDLKNTSGEQLSRLVEQSGGFAEIFPEDKFLIVQALQKERHVVGMTGDGVNDAPALRQSEVGIAVSSATDVAKKAASAVLTTEGLVGIVDLVKIGRMTYQRVTTWILNKIIKTFQITVFVVLAFLLTRLYVISTLHMILLLFLTDFVTLSLSTDNVRYSEKPDMWKIGGLVKVSLCLGILVIGELLFFLHMGLSYFGLSSHINQLHTFTFAVLVYVELLDVMMIRERRHFWNSRPSRFLALAIAADLALVFLISILGLPGIAPITPLAAFAVVGFSLFVALVVNDPLKVFLIRRFLGTR